MNVTLLSGACIKIIVDYSFLSAVYIFTNVCLYTCLYSSFIVYYANKAAQNHKRTVK